MTVPEVAWHDVLPLTPALILSVGAIFLLITEVFLSTASRAYQAAVALISAVAAGLVAMKLAAMPSREVFFGFGVLDGFSSLTTAIVCLGLSLAVLLSFGFLRHRNAERGEFYALMLFAGAGMSLLALSSELITIFISLETMSISTYALVCYLRRGKRPSEAGFKYFILGAFSSALLLYGFALIYGATGSTHLNAISRAIPAAMQAQPALVYCGALLIAAGFGFKVAAVPLHMWTPDVYEGAPTPVTTLMSVGVKAAAFAVLIRVFSALGSGSDLTLASVVFSVVALLTMVVGNLVALPQRNVKRMLAYSSIAHAGYLLLGVAALFAHPGAAQVGWQFLNATPLTSAASAAELARAGTLRAILFYLLAYTVTAAGAFGTLSALERREDEEKPTAWDLDQFSGLAQRRPGWAIAMAVFMLSLGGIPPTVGFIGKLLIFQSAVGAGLVGLVVIGILSSVAGAYYYLRVVVYMFMRPVDERALLPPSRQWATEAALVLSTVAVLALGILPGIALGWFTSAAALWAGP